VADNNITVVGNITREPELRFTQGGQAVTTFSMAVNRRWTQNGEQKESVSYFDVKAWGQLGENIASSLTKGSRVIASGRLEQRSYETNNGEKRSAVEIVADEVGPSLRWATASLERNARTGGDAGSSMASRTPSANPTQDQYSPDEEPF
jgi:single-strand DNA-binding protein